MNKQRKLIKLNSIFPLTLFTMMSGLNVEINASEPLVYSNATPQHAQVNHTPGTTDNSQQDTDVDQQAQHQLALEAERRNKDELSHQLERVGYQIDEIARIFSVMKEHNLRVNNALLYIEHQDAKDSTITEKHKFHIFNTKGIVLNSFKFMQNQ